MQEFTLKEKSTENKPAAIKVIVRKSSNGHEAIVLQIGKTGTNSTLCDNIVNIVFEKEKTIELFRDMSGLEIRAFRERARILGEMLIEASKMEIEL